MAGEITFNSGTHDINFYSRITPLQDDDIVLLNFTGTHGDTTTSDDSIYAHPVTLSSLESQISNVQYIGAPTSLYVKTNAFIDFCKVHNTGNWVDKLKEQNDFELELYMRPDVVNILPEFFSWRGGGKGCDFRWDWGAGLLSFVYEKSEGGAAIIQATDTYFFQAENWYGVWLERKSNVFKFFVNDVSLGSGYSQIGVSATETAGISITALSGHLHIMENINQGGYDDFTGYVDNVRVTAFTGGDSVEINFYD